MPGASEFVSRISERLSAPIVTFTVISGAFAAAMTLVIGLVLGLAFSNQSLIGLVDHGKGVIGAGFAQTVNFIQVGFGDGGRLGPALFVVFPVGACAFAAATQARRTLGLPPTARLLAGAAVGAVFGPMMLIAVVGAGSLDGLPSNAYEPDAFEAVAMGVLWGALGGLLGTYYVVRTALGSGFITGLVSPAVRAMTNTLWLALRPLVVLLVATSLVGTVTWSVETFLSADYRQASSTPLAVIDNAAYAVEHGVSWAELGALAQFEAPVGGVSSDESPIPVGDPSKLHVKPGGRYGLFDYAGALPVYTFAPLTLFLVGGVLVMAFSAGAAVARARRPAGQLAAAGVGSLVGPAWALTMTSVNALVSKTAFGRAYGGSVFWSFLIGGLVVGACGGIVAAQTHPRHELGDLTARVAAAATTNLEGP